MNLRCVARIMCNGEPTPGRFCTETSEVVLDLDGRTYDEYAAVARHVFEERGWKVGRGGASVNVCPVCLHETT